VLLICLAAVVLVFTVIITPIQHNQLAHMLGSHVARDSWVSVLYPEGLNSAKSSGTLQRTDRHGIVGQKSSDFQRFL
jgi:hypothetical protein